MLCICTFIQAILSAFIMFDINPEREVNAPGGTFIFPEKKGWFSSNTVANMAYFVIHYWIVRAIKY